MDFGAIFVVILYQGAMAYALLMLGGYWAAGARSAGGPLFFILGVAAPLCASIFTFLKPPFSLAGPLCLAVLYRTLERDERELRAAREERDASELEAASLRVAADPDDGVSHMTRAELLERAGRWGEARESYQRAHALSDRMLPKPELDQILARLEEAEQAPGLEARQDHLQLAGRWIERVLTACGAALLFYLPYAGLSLVATMLFLGWYRDYARRG